MSRSIEAATRLHAVRRFRERCGVELPLRQYNRINAAIASGSVPHVATTREGVRVFHVRYAGVSAYAVWKGVRGQVATFYPSLDWVTAKGGTVARAHG
jgi:hypothetical protein